MRAIAGLISATTTTEQKLLHARQARTHTYQLASTIGRTAAAILAMSILPLVVMPLLLTRLRSTEATLHESEDRLRLLVSSIRDPAIWMLDRDGRVEKWSEDAQEMTGYRPGEALGQLTGGGAHDFNNLLTAILGTIETL